MLLAEAEFVGEGQHLKHVGFVIATGTMVLGLYGCETSDRIPPDVVPVSAPTTSLIGSGPSINPAYMPSYCQGELATRNLTNPSLVQASSAMRQADGSTIVNAKVVKPDEAMKAFKCRYDGRGAFVDAIEVISEGV
jgi:hypothetical protein